MKSRMILAALAAALVVGLVSIVAVAENDEVLGNGAPQAKLLGSLNIIGVSNPKNVNMNDKSGNTIFVMLKDTETVDAVNAIYLTNSREAVGEDVFEVVDKVAWDADGGEFMLPPPDFNPYNVTTGAGKTDTVTGYSVFVRPLGKPDGFATITTCAELSTSALVSSGLLSGTFIRTLNKSCVVNPDALASVEQVGTDILTRKTGPSKFANVTAELTSIVLMVQVQTGTGVVTEYIRVPIFDPMLDGEYWEYDNDGLKLCQVRFYDVPTDVALSDGSWNNLP